jgi:hypothetical protein
MKTNSGAEVQLHAALAAALDGAERSCLRPDPFTPGTCHRYPVDRMLI